MTAEEALGRVRLRSTYAVYAAAYRVLLGDDGFPRTNPAYWAEQADEFVTQVTLAEGCDTVARA